MPRHAVIGLLILIVICSYLSAAADTMTVMRTIPVAARMMTVDELGNIYLVKTDNSLVRYTEQGDSTTVYQGVQNGEIGSVDVSNPLRIVVYYPAYGRIVLLDRMLAKKNELDLKKINILNASVVAAGADGNLWVYDPFNAKLRKIDEQLHEIGQSNDLRQDAGMVPTPSFMVERERRLFICDTAQGILTFDRYGSYINTLSIYGVKYLQVYGPQLIYLHGDTLSSYNMDAITWNDIPLPDGDQPIINAALNRSTLYILYADRLVLYRMAESK